MKLRLKLTVYLLALYAVCLGLAGCSQEPRSSSCLYYDPATGNGECVR